MSQSNDQKPQSQESLYKQLLKAIDLCNKAGLYDAADLITTVTQGITAANKN